MINIKTLFKNISLKNYDGDIQCKQKRIILDSRFFIFFYIVVTFGKFSDNTLSCTQFHPVAVNTELE